MNWPIFKRQLPLVAIILLIGEFGEVLWRTEGHYHARRLSYTLGLVLLFMFSSINKRYLNLQNVFQLKFFKQTIFFILAYWNYKTFLDPKVIYLQISWINYLFKYSSLFFCVLFLGFIFKPKKFTPKMAWVILTVLLSFRILTLIGSPNPLIDVFTSNTDAVGQLLQLKNPYTFQYTDIYNGRYDYRPGLVYWPGIFLWQLPSFILFKDVRALFIFAEIMMLLAFLRLMKNLDVEKSLIWLICLLWSFFPVQNFVLEQSWIDPGLMALTAWFFVFMMEEKYYLSAVILGLMVSTKQYAVITAIIFIPHLLDKLKFKKFISFVFFSIISALALVLPFFLNNPQKFIEMTITVPSLQAFRSDSFSFIAVLWNNFNDINFSILTWLMPLLFLILSFIFVLFKKNLKNCALGLFYCYLGIFLFGKQAFCNYYFFLMIFLFIFLIFELSNKNSQSIFEK